MTAWHIRIPSTVYTLAAHEVQQALPNETGGILIGWRERTTAVVISQLIVVPDSNAGVTHYTLDHDAAQAALDEHRGNHPDEAEGYVGEWHSHPEHQPPSPLDHASFRAAASILALPIAMIVIAFDSTQGTLSAYGHVAHRRLHRRVTVTPATIQPSAKDSHERRHGR